MIKKDNELGEELEGEYGDIYSLKFEFEPPKTDGGYNYLFDEIDNISTKALMDVAELFGVEIEEIDNYNMVKEISEVILSKLEKYFNVNVDIKNPQD